MMDTALLAPPQVDRLSGASDESEIDITSFIVPQVIEKGDSESDESSDHFFTEDLVWPDPDHVFPKSSGIKPAVLTADLKHLNTGTMDFLPKTKCQSALIVRKRPRPKTLPWNVVVIDSDPPIVEADDVEEYLVHDPLFVEFFNAFLALPSFPEAVYFNIESGGFEVVTDCKLKLAQHIKEAVRSQTTKVDIYETVRQHAFSDIPVVPIEDTKGPEQEQIERTFDVMALNKEQGILWVKSARLPKFLESDFYIQYRLAKVISQVSIFNDKGEFVVMKIDYTTKPKTKKKAIEVHPPTQEELIVKEMFVSFGDLKGAAKEAWFTQAKKHLKPDVTFTTLNQRPSSIPPEEVPSSETPSKKSSVFSSHYFGVYSPGLIGPNETEPPVHDLGKMKDNMMLRERPFTPRPSDRIHAATTMLRAKLSSDPSAGEDMVPAGNVVFLWPKQDFQTISAESELEDQAGRETEFAKRMREHQIIDQIYSDGSWEELGTGNIVLKSVDELGAVIVGAVLKKSLADLLKVNEETVVNDPTISSIYPSKDLTCVSVDKLNLCVVVEASEHKENEISRAPSVMDDTVADGEIPDKQPVHIKWHKPIIKPAEEDTEEESLLDSDEDFEERDKHFRRSKNKWHSLTSMKGIQAFKKFLVGTQGEKYWELWIDIDKGRLIRNEEEKQKYILHMRDKFYKKGAQFELSAENKRKLNLENLSQWTPEYLFQVQAKVLEPLVLYWAPRYLLSHLILTDPEKYYLYNELKAVAFNPASDPYPNTQELLPLRPKSCCPNNRLGLGVGEMNYNMFATDADDLATAPRVGNRRIYGEDTIKRLANTPTSRYLRKMTTKRKSGLSSKIQVADAFLNSVDMKLSPDLNKLLSVKSSKYLQSDNSDMLGSQLSDSTVTTLAQRPHPSVCATIPCPYKPLNVLFSTRGDQRPVSKVSRGLLPPLVKPGDQKSNKCKEFKRAPIRKSDSEDNANYTFFRQDSKETSKSCQMYHSSLTKSQMPTEDAESRECEFLSSQRLAILLQALHHEHDSGRTFRKYIISSKRQDWLNNLDFWEKVQEYRKLFYKDKLDLHLITKHARSIFAQCIVEGAPQSIHVSEPVKLFILDRLNPPYEDLFDQAEENALVMLFEAFQLYMQQDVKNYCEVERAWKERRLETRNTHILNLQKLGLIKERPLTPDDPMEGYVDPVYDDSILQRVPEQFRNWNMAKLAQNKLELEYFRQFLIPRCAEIDLTCWMDMEAWRRTAPDDSALRDQRAIDIKKNYLNKKYFFGPNSPAGKDGQNKVMEVGGGWGKFLEDKPHFNSILKAQKYVRARLENKHLPFFLLSRDFQERYLLDSSMTIDEEEAFLLNQRRSIAMMRVINEGEEAFESAREKKEKLFVDLSYWTAEGQDRPQSIRISASIAELSTTISERSMMSGHPILPPIDTEKQQLHPETPPKSMAIRKKVPAKPAKLVPPKQAMKPRLSLREGIPGSSDSGLSYSHDYRHSLSRWDVLLQKHAKLITPMGLIEHVIAAPSDASLNVESKWTTAIREVFLLQRALKNPTSCAQFKKFVSLSGGFLENDILFWLEVQKYKKMHKNGVDATLQRKVNAIINCFINSYLPPALQIDIPQEMADDILDHRFELDNKLFQKAQLEVFRRLLPHWVAFREYHRRLLDSGRVMQTLDRHRAVALSKEQKYREKLAHDREMERQMRLLAAEQAKEAQEKAEKEADSYSYADYLAEQGIVSDDQILASFIVKGTQTVRGIPEYPHQPIEERPGFVDDPDIDENAKYYSIVDYITYREYLKLEETQAREKAVKQKPSETKDDKPGHSSSAAKRGEASGKVSDSLASDHEIAADSKSSKGSKTSKQSSSPQK